MPRKRPAAPKGATSQVEPGGLSLRHLNFARLIIGGAAAWEAYAAVYPKASEATARTEGPALLRKSHVAEFVDKARAKAAVKADVTADYVLAGLLEVSKRCRQAVPVMVFDREAQEYQQLRDEETGEGVWQFDSAGANRSLELLGKYLKLFTDRVEVMQRPYAELVAEAARRLREKKSGGAP